MSSEEYRIAVGSAGSATGLGVLRSLACWDSVVWCLACDINPSHLVAASTEFEFLQVPPAVSANFVETLSDELSWKGIKAYYPIHDGEIAAASSERALLAAREITLLAPSDESILIARDKLRLAAVLTDADVPAPKTTRLDLAQWDGAALHIKPRTGVGSSGATAIHDAISFASYQSASDAELMIAQPFITGHEVTIDAFCPEPGTVQAIACRERLEVKAGVSTKARIFVDQELADLTAGVSRALGLTGSFCYQVRGTAKDGWQVIDVNPRVGGGTAMSVAVGLDFPSAHAAHFLGHDPTEFFKPLHKSDVFVTRSFREHVAW